MLALQCFSNQLEGHVTYGASQVVIWVWPHPRAVYLMDNYKALQQEGGGVRGAPATCQRSGHRVLPGRHGVPCPPNLPHGLGSQSPSQPGTGSP